VREGGGGEGQEGQLGASREEGRGRGVGGRREDGGGYHQISHDFLSSVFEV
jgi:hypothetical protein